MAGNNNDNVPNDDRGENKTSLHQQTTPLDKDYAQYPPTPTKQVVKHLTKKLKETETAATGNIRYAGTDTSSSLVTEDNTITNCDTRVVNESQRVVNGNEEIQSVGSGGAFEATEQVN